jgi:exodeoxyribonuclease VII large subunit
MDSSAKNAVLTVAQLTRQIKDVVEGNFPLVYVRGEISNCTRAGSGHIYLTLKDHSAQLRAVIWRGTAARIRFDIHDGLEVVAAGPIEVYEARGTYQLVVEQLVPQGIGALELAFRQMCAKLEAEGLFAAERKRPLPRFPRRIALVTSPSGAAVRDMLQVIARRWPAVDVVVVPVAVQGEGAAAQIAAALRHVHRIPRVDVVIAGRGGGSLEDLWAFNEEPVARAIFECRLPVISGVGHEIDVTIADLVADRRALTPSEAAELAVPYRADVLADLQRLQQRLVHGLTSRAITARAKLDAIASRRVFARPFDRLHDEFRRLDEIELRLRRAASQRIETAKQRLVAVSAALGALSPLQVLERGYSVTRNAETGEVLRSAREAAPGDRIESRLKQGRLISRVEEILE